MENREQGTGNREQGERSVTSAPLVHVLDVVADVVEEHDRAVSLHEPLASAHEACAVILEEMDEFKAEVWKRSSQRDHAAMRKELLQVAAMAVRAIVDLKL